MNDSIIVKSFPAVEGECFLISLKSEEKTTNILIDTGYDLTVKYIIDECKQLKKNNQILDLLILTHIDNDHISGASEVLHQIHINDTVEIGQIWYNGYFKLCKMDNDIVEACNQISSNDKKILGRILSSPYSGEQKKFKDQEIGFRTTQYIEQYLFDEKFCHKWNPGFDNQCVAIQNKIIKKKLNEKVSITILGPTFDILKKQFQDWKEYLTQKGFSSTLLNFHEIANAFEHTLMQKERRKVVVREQLCGGARDEFFKYLNYENFDRAIANRSSISVVIEFSGKKLMFLGDSSPIDIEKSIDEYRKANGENIMFDLVKIPHHGSKNNWSIKLNNLIKSNRYLIATNGAQYNHPDLETMVKIISHNEYTKMIYFNYKPEHIIRKVRLMKELEETTYNIVYENDKKSQVKIQEIRI